MSSEPAFKAFAAEIRPGQPPEKLSVEAFRDRNPESCGFGWMHVVAHQPEAVNRLLLEEFGFGHVTVNDLMESHMRAGLEQSASHSAFLVMAILPGVPADYAPVGIFFAPHLMVTVSLRDVPTMAEVFQAWLNEPEDIGVDCPSVLLSVLDALVDDYFPALDQIHEAIEDLEELVYAGADLTPERAIRAKRQLLVMRKQVAPTRDTLNALVRYGSPVIPAEKLVALGDLYNHLLRLTENIDLGRDILSSIMEAQVNVVNNRLSKTIQTLTVVSTILMSCSLIAGIYGMNFDRMPELRHPWGYPIALGMMLLASLGLLAVFRKCRWI